jgi:hypothetical protein
MQGIVPRIPAEAVVSSIAKQLIITRSAAAKTKSVAQIIVPGAATQDVGTIATKQQVAPSLSEQFIIACLAPEDIRVISAKQAIITGVTREKIGTTVAEKGIVALIAVHPVVVSAAAKNVLAAPPFQRIFT